MEVKVFIHAQWNKYSKAFSYSALQCDMTEYGYILLETKTVEFVVPVDKELRNAAVRVLRAKRNKVLADAGVEAQNIDDEVQELLCLPAPTAEEKDDCPF